MRRVEPQTRAAAIRCALLIALAFPVGAHAQSSAVAPHPALETVTRLFDAMRARDTAAMRAAFVARPALASWSERDGESRVQHDSLDAFITSIARAPAGLLLDERIYAPKVEVSDGVASVWVEYDFYAGERFSHCGVDAVHLVQTAQGWKIAHLVDTRRRVNCPKR